jgi:hypothetical protein
MEKKLARVLAQERAMMPKRLRDWEIEARMLLEVERVNAGRRLA